MKKKTNIRHEIIENSVINNIVSNQLLEKYDLFLCNCNLDDKQKKDLTDLIGTMCIYIDKRARFKYEKK